MADSEFKQPATKILAVTKVKQIAAIEEFQLLIVLSHRSLQVYSISAVVGRPPTAQMVQTVQGHCSVFKEGSYMGKYLICSVDSSTFSSTGRVFELETCTPKATKDLPTKDTVSLKLFKEFYLPCTTSAVFLIDSAVCLACTNGFNLLSLDSLEVKTFPHTTNRLSNWTFFWKNTTAKHVQPMNDDLLLSYSDVSLLINREGQRTRPEWHIDWNSRPQSFSLLHPWIIAFNDHFVEFRNIEQDTAYVLVRKKTRLLYGDRGKVFCSFPLCIAMSC